MERRREIRYGILTAHVDLNKAFDSVHREALGNLLRLHGIPTWILDLVIALYAETESAVKCVGGTGASPTSFL